MDDLQFLEKNYNDLGAAIYDIAFKAHQNHYGSQVVCAEEICRRSSQAMSAFRRLSESMKKLFEKKPV